MKYVVVNFVQINVRPHICYNVPTAKMKCLACYRYTIFNL